MYGQIALDLVAEEDPLAGLREALLTRRPEADFGLLQRAYEVARDFHQGQFRESGDPYISHPVTVATLMAAFGADDRMLCAAILHDTVQYSYATPAALRRKFGSDVAAMVSEAMALKNFGSRPDVTVADELAAIGGADQRVVTLRVAERLHNMRTIEFLRPPKQLLKARETLDIFAPTAEVLRLPGVGSELQNLAFGTMVRSQPARRSVQRTIVALDIERSTSRADQVKRQLRIMLYELFKAALRAAGWCPRSRGC
jgi:guanosine-3',5'-bis(diphosphate) 3'-pyrophosphohydrolase